MRSPPLHETTGHWPFVGREAELEAAAAALAGAGVLVVAGEAGVGKSRFVRELVDRQPAEATVLVAAASSREVPLGAFAPLIESAGIDAPELLGRALVALRDRLVVVDDAHLLDEVSATLVGHLAVEPTARLLLAVRTGEPAPAAVTGVWRSGDVARVELGPFTLARCTRLLRAVLDGPVAARDARRLHEVTRGNPLWLGHLIEGERAAGRLVWTEGAWQWRGPDGLPPALGALVAERIGALGPAQRRTLELVALGEPLGLGSITALAGAEAIEEVAERGLVAVEPEGARWNVRLGHPLYGEAVRAALSAPHAERLRGELSSALARAGGRRSDDGLRRAVLDLGSDRHLDPGTLVEAARQATVLGDHALAERLLRAACDAGGGFPARMGLAHLMVHLLRHDEAAAELARAADEACSDEERVRVTVVRAAWLFWTVRRPGAALAALAHTEAGVRPDTRLPLEGVRAMMAVARGDFAAGRRHAEVALADPGLTPSGTAHAVWATALRAGHVDGRPPRELVERGLAAAASCPEAASLIPAIAFADVVAAEVAGEPELGARREAWAESLPGSGSRAIVALCRGRLALAAGRPGVAAALLESAVPTSHGHAGGWGIGLQAMLARAHAMTGDRAAARRSVQLADSLRDPTTAALRWELELARAWVAATEGARTHAVRHLLEAVDVVQRREAWAVEVLLRQTAVRFGARGQAGRLTHLAATVGTARARLAAAHVTALVHADEERLLAVSDELETAGMVLEAVDVAAQAAVIARDAGRSAASSAATARAWSLAARCDATTPALEALGLLRSLTGREREIATLVAEGLTNRAIADRLRLSVRTVESHVYRACARLGLADRAALTAAVTPDARR